MHKCFISFKMEDEEYKRKISDLLQKKLIDKSLDKPIDSENEDYIMEKIREDYLSDSTVTIFLIGNHSAENSVDDQTYIKRELQASLYNGKNNTRNGILGIVLPNMYSTIYKGTYTCSKCFKTHNHVAINDSTTIKEFSYNYYLPNPSGCAWTDDDCYCVLVKWNDFIKNAQLYINQAFDKRNAPIASKIKVRP